MNLDDMPELMPGAAPGANSAQKEDFEQRCRQLYHNAEVVRASEAEHAHRASGGAARAADMEAMFPMMDPALVRSLFAEAPTPQHAIETLLALSAEMAEPVAGGAPARAATPPPLDLGVEDQEKFPSLGGSSGSKANRPRVRTASASADDIEEDLGSAWRDRAKAAAGLPAPKVFSVVTTARRRRNKESIDGANEDGPLHETEYEFRHRVGQRRANTRTQYGRGVGKGAAGAGRGGGYGGGAEGDEGHSSESEAPLVSGFSW